MIRKLFKKIVIYRQFKQSIYDWYMSLDEEHLYPASTILGLLIGVIGMFLITT